MFVLFFMVMMVLLLMLVLFLMMVVMVVFTMMLLAFVLMMIMMMILVRMGMGMGHTMSMGVFVAVLMSEMNIKFYSFNGSLVRASDVQMVPVQFQLLQFPFQFVWIDPEINERADEHVAADAAENIQVQCFHLFPLCACANSLIWLAA